MDTWVAGDGLEQRQSVPYALSYWYSGKPNEPNPYRGQRIEPGEASPVPYTVTTLDLLGRAVQVTAPDGTTTQTTYTILKDAQGNPYQQTCVTDAKDNITCKRTDSRGRTVEVDPPEGPGVSYTYDAADRLKTATMGGAGTELWYDYAGRKTKMDDADMGFWQYGYDALSQLREQTDARSCITTLKYDLAGRLSGKTYNVSGCTGVPSTASVTNIYDGVLHWQPFDSWPTSGWTKLGNVTVSNGQVHLAGNGTDWNTYIHRDGTLKDGRAVRFSFQANTTTALAILMVYSGTWGTSDYRRWSLKLESGYLKRESYAGSTPSTVSLMALKANTWYEGVLSIDGTLPASSSESYNPRFRVVVWERDNPNVWAQNRSQFATGWNGKDWYYFAQVKSGTVDIDYEQEYDEGAVGQRSKMVDGSGNTEWTYTSRGQVQSEKKTITGSGSFLTQYGYHPDGSVRWLQYPDNEKLTYLYHAQKAPSSLQTSLDNGLYYLSSVSYGDVYYNSTSERYILHKLGNDGLQLKQTFFAWSTPNGNGRLKQITAGTTGAPTSLLDLRYYSGTNTPAYDSVGNILNIYDYKVGSPQTLTFGYDDLYRLLTASATGGTDGTYSETYTYDPNTGNLASKTGMGNYTYGNPDHAHAVTATNGKSYGYDANGNQITRVIGSITFTLSYDAENRLVSVSWAIGSTNHSMTFVFDGDGNRVRSTLDGTTTTFAGTHYEVTGSAVTKYYYSGASRIAMRSSIGVRYIFGDHLGSASVTADRYGGSITRQLYKPYGETRSSGSVPTKYTFTGQYSYSTEIGLMYYVVRFFDPQLGRFVSADTIVPQPGSPLDWDRYLFVRGNPLKYTDPTGHCGEGSSPGEGVSEAEHYRLCILHDEAIRLSLLLKNGEITDVDVLAMMLDFAANLYSIKINIPLPSGLGKTLDIKITIYEDKHEFYRGLGIVLGGLEVRDSLGDYFQYVTDYARGTFDPNSTNRLIRAGAEVDPLGQYYVGYDAFTNPTGESGFNPELSPGPDNQIRHFVGGIRGGSAFGQLGRSRMLSGETDPIDRNMYLKAFALVDHLNVNPISAAGDWVRENMK